MPNAGRMTMSYKIVVDSCGELTEEMKKSGHFETASLEIECQRAPYSLMTRHLIRRNS